MFDYWLLDCLFVLRVFDLNYYVCLVGLVVFWWLFVVSHWLVVCCLGCCLLAVCVSCLFTLIGF